MKVILSGYFGFKNFGDEAILTLIISKLKELNADITVITSNSDYTKSLHKNITTIYTFDILNIIKGIIKSDILISGGGSLLQDVTGIKSLFYYLFIIFAAKLAGKKVIIFAQGIGPINSNIGKIVTKIILKTCNLITVRDNNSLSKLKEWGVHANLVNDPIFSIPIKETIKSQSVAIQLRGFKTMNEDFIQRLAQKVNTLFWDKHISIYSFQDSIDLEVCERFKQELTILNPDINVDIYSDLSISEIIESISTCQYLIGMRFHSLIIGLIAGVKTLAINYDIKVKTLAQEFGIPYINLTGDFGNKFENLINQDTQQTHLKAVSKNFDWSKFETILNN